MQLNQEMEKTEERYVLFIYMMQCYDKFCRREFSEKKKKKYLYVILIGGTAIDNEHVEH